jgi:hypothetical protein
MNGTIAAILTAVACAAGIAVVQPPLTKKTLKVHVEDDASAPVPADRTKVSGMKYMSSRAEWLADEETHAGFACLGFEMTFPQYFQYEYDSTSTGFVARAHGDLDGDGIFSTYEISGELVGGHVVVSPTIRETNPGE